MLFFPFLLAAVPALAYTIVPGLADPLQPSCTAFTFYYNDPTDLASATSTFALSKSFCATTSTTAPSASPSLCDTSGLYVTLFNPDFECTAANALSGGWGSDTDGGLAAIEIVAGTIANPAQSGNYMLKVLPLKPNGETTIFQDVIDALGAVVTFTWWAKLDPVFNDLTGCTFHAVIGLSTGNALRQDFLGPGGHQPPTTSWQQYTFTFTGTGTDALSVHWESCSAGAIIYFDNFKHSFVE